MNRAFRLRQVAWVTADIAARVEQMGAIFGMPVAFRDPAIQLFDMANVLLNAGGDFIEIVEPFTAKSSAGRFYGKRGHDAGYMLIFQCEDALAERQRLEEIGIHGTFQGEAQADISSGFLNGRALTAECAEHLEVLDRTHRCTHYHPRDFTGILTSFDSIIDEPDWQAPDSAWSPAGAQWHSARTPFVKALAGVSIATADPLAAADHWSRLLELPVTERNGAPAIALVRSHLRFVAPAAGGPTGLVGLTLEVQDRDLAIARGRDAGVSAKGFTLDFDGFGIDCT